MARKFEDAMNRVRNGETRGYGVSSSYDDEEEKKSHFWSRSKDDESGEEDDEEEKEAGEIAMKPCCLPQVPPPLDGGVPGLQM